MWRIELRSRCRCLSPLEDQVQQQTALSTLQKEGKKKEKEIQDQRFKIAKDSANNRS